jgi:hypothetical protein
MIGSIYAAGQSGGVNWWVLGPALLAIALLMLAHTSSGRSL